MSVATQLLLNQVAGQLMSGAFGGAPRLHYYPIKIKADRKGHVEVILSPWHIHLAYQCGVSLGEFAKMAFDNRWDRS